MDHIEWLSGDPCGQEALVSILDAISARHGKVVVASIHPPGDVEGLTPPVRARADSGLCVRMDMPDLDACMAILRVKAAECGYDPLPDALAHLLATQTFAKDGVRRLDYWLRRVLATADFTDRPVSPGLAKEVLNDASHA